MKKLVYVGIKGGVVALDLTTGTEAWSTKLKGGDFVNLMLDDDRVLAGTKGQIFCLNANTGEVLWNNALPGWGLGLLSIATSAGSTSFVPAEQKKKQERAATAAVLSAS